jgi:hypothetical protein
MAKDSRGKFWQVCPACERKQHSDEPVVCSCGEKMIDALEHPDNAHRKQLGHKSPAPKPAATP